MADQDLAELRQKAVTLLRDVRDYIGKDDEVAALVAKLERSDVVLLSTIGHAGYVENLEHFRKAANALRSYGQVPLPVALDLDALAGLEAQATRVGAFIRDETVSFEQIRHALRGTFGNARLSARIGVFLRELHGVEVRLVTETHADHAAGPQPIRA